MARVMLKAWLVLAVIVLGPGACVRGQEQPVDAAALSQSAHALLDSGDISGAQAKFEMILAKAPSAKEAPDAKLRLAYLKIRTHAPKADVIRAFEETAAVYPDSQEAAESLFHAAQSRLSSGNKIYGTQEFDDAIAAFDRAAKHPKMIPVMAARCKMQGSFTYMMRYYNSHDKQDLKKAIAGLEVSATADNPSLAYRAHALIGIGEAQILLRDFGAAEKAYQAAAELSPDKLPFETSMAIYGWGMAKAWRNDASGATKLLQGFLSGVTGKTVLEKDASWRSGFSRDYAPAGKNAVRNAAIQLAWAKSMKGDPAGALSDFDGIIKDFAADAKIVKAATRYRDTISQIMPSEGAGKEVAK